MERGKERQCNKNFPPFPPLAPSHLLPFPQGTIVKANSFSYDAKKEGLDAKNAESHTLAAMSAWSKNANATAVVDDGSMKMVGSAGVIAVSGEAYIVELMGA